MSARHDDIHHDTHEGDIDDNIKVTVLNRNELWKVLKRVLSFSSPDLFNMGLGTLSLIVNSVTNLYFPYAIGKIVDNACQRNKLGISDIQGPSLFFITGAVASFVRVYNFGLVKEQSAARLKSALLSNFLSQELTFFEKVGAGELLTTLEKDVEVTAEIVSDKIPAALRSFNSALLGSVFLFRVSPYLCGVSLSTIPIVGIIAVALGKTSSKLNSSLRELEKKQAVFVSERLRNIPTVFVNDMQGQERKVFDDFSEMILSKSKMKYFTNGIRMSFVNIATNASIIAVLYTGSSMVSRKEITQGDLTSFLMRSGFVALGFSSMSSVYSELRAALTSASRVFEYIDMRACPSNYMTDLSHEAIDDDAISLSSFVDVSVPSVDGNSQSPVISFKNVSFSYPNRLKVRCLKSLNVDLFSQRITAIVGSSGSGKSSMVALMCALYKPLSGQLIIGDKELSSCTYEDVKHIRSKIAVVQQSCVLFSGTIAYNIGYGMPNASREKIEDVARMAFSHEFIMRMTDGYDTEVGEGGVGLSGGQRQRIALCRALLRDPEILILDEPSSSLDCENEDNLIQLLCCLRKTKCIVVFTHSSRIMAVADSLHLLEDGTVTASGTFPTLKNLDSFKFVLQSTAESNES